MIISNVCKYREPGRKLGWKFSARFLVHDNRKIVKIKKKFLVKILFIYYYSANAILLDKALM